ncbi:MAG TPA: S41 family peptidase [Chlamydiales bacterium]|nr:S41 family peptidase [Chlamydiales bacterium]
MRLKKWLLFFLLIGSILECKLPLLTPRSAKEKFEEVLKGHATYKSLTPELIQRVFHSFLDELDPTKTYFIHSEIDRWVHATDDLLSDTLVRLKRCDYSTFSEIHALFLKAIERREALEIAIGDKELPKSVQKSEFQDISTLPWAIDTNELETRIMKIKALQLESAGKMGEEGKSRFLQIVEKRRLNRESELKGDGEGAERAILTLFLKAAMESLDSHTNYFTPTEANQFMIQVQQRLFGIGAQLRDDLDGLVVVRILENSPASRSGKLKINDKIIAVNQEPVVGLDITEAVELIRGPEGTEVQLTLIRECDEGSETLELELTRGEIVLEDSRLETTVEPFGDGAIAILRLFSFYQDLNFSSASDMRKALDEIKLEKNLKGVIVDLRGNGGGLLSQAVSVAGLFITKGIVVSVKDDTGKIQHLRETEGKPVWDGPLLILVDRASASAAEIVAQTLQDYGRALVVGDTHTFGKGSFQTFTLDAIHNPKINPEGEYKVTRGKYYTVSGKSPQLKGVLSDIAVPGLLSGVDIGEEFSKFPLANDQISPHFDDDLSDLSAFQRLKLGNSYRQNLQVPLSTYKPFIASLQSNSKERIGKSKNYQSSLKEIEKKNFDSLQVDLFGKCDLQLLEAINVMKDLIYLGDKGK